MNAISTASEVDTACEDRGSECLVRLSGRISIDSSPALRVFLFRRLQSPSCQTLTLDMSQVAYIDTSGLAVLVETLRAARTRGKAVRVAELTGRPRYLLETSRLMNLFDEAAL